MACELSRAIGAYGRPASLGHLCVAAALGLGANAAANLLPSGAVPFFTASQCMSDLMQNTVAYRFGVVGQYEIHRQLNPPFFMAAKAHGALGAIKGKGPLGKPVLAHQIQGDPLCVRGSKRAYAVHDLSVK
jgi:hypothetical protein